MEPRGELKSSPNLKAVGAGGDGMATASAIAAKTGVVAAAALLLSEGTMGTTSGIHIHGGMRGEGEGGTGGGWKEWAWGYMEGGEGWWERDEAAAVWLSSTEMAADVNA